MRNGFGRLTGLVCIPLTSYFYLNLFSSFFAYFSFYQGKMMLGMALEGSQV